MIAQKQLRYFADLFLIFSTFRRQILFTYMYTVQNTDIVGEFIKKKLLLNSYLVCLVLKTEIFELQTKCIINLIFL